MSSSSKIPVFAEPQLALENLGSLMDASEAQGVLCGLLLDNQGMVKWLQAILDVLPDSNDVLAKEQLLVLKSVFESSREQLNNEEMSLQLLLPDEDKNFSDRLLGLASWCQGFLFGYALTPKAKMDKAGGVDDCLDDLLQISQLSHDEEQSEAAELHFTELEEYVRMAVIFLNDELNPVLDSPQVQ